MSAFDKADVDPLSQTVGWLRRSSWEVVALKEKFAMPQSTHKVVHPESTYDVIELIGTSTKSWEDAANADISDRLADVR
jgi:dodecin